ncbi:actin interacting protein 3-domain-containing protein [Bombardia bombarda]|uniref:Actin interacting protein 3-domain-containing protein n=1 Tax=Bombardia bombarda TaxID=252184 RepID=A0AA40CD69_9PEZI|nr:actin interacting protein 3-domain-containing protein [Bombardia bombarda]
MGVGTNSGVAPRSSTASGRTGGGGGGGGSGGGMGGGSTRRNNSGGGSSSVPLSQIEKSVTHLLVATKQLLETLTQWSRGNATDTQVSDVYVRLGYEFNMACRAFTAINVDTSDLGNVPELLRDILESTLSQEASVESLERYLPRIRDIIINLLHGLKRKQQKLRQKQAREKENGVQTGEQGPSAANAAVVAAQAAGGPGRTTSSSTMGSVNSGLTTLLNEGLENGYRPDAVREDSRNNNNNASPTRRFQREQSRGSVNSEQSMSSITMQSIPVLPPYPGDEASMPSGPSAGDLNNLDNFPPPPPPPKPSQQSALAALQRGGDLERRASRRYSAYQISKHLGAQAAGIPMLPPQTTPIPNRGRGEVRESMRAMQARENIRHNRNTPSQSSRTGALDSSPVRVPSRVSEEPEEAAAALAELPAPVMRNESFPMPTPPDKYPQASATLNGPPDDMLPIIGGVDDDEGFSPSAAKNNRKQLPAEPKSSPPVPHAPTPERQQQQSSFILGSNNNEAPPPSPPSLPASATKELTLFLQYKSKVKKFVLPEGYEELTIGRLQLAFIEKFSWNTQQNGADLPDIYIQDPVSGVRHELEDLSDIKDRTVLVLNVEPLDEVKRHIDEGLGSLTRIMQEVRQNVDDQGQAIQRVSERQQETAKDVARLAAAPPPAPPMVVMTPPADSVSPRGTGPGQAAMRKAMAAVGGGSPSQQVSEIQSLRRDLAVLRQTYSNFQSEVQGSMGVLRTKANNVKAAAAKVSIEGLGIGGGEGNEGASIAGKAYVVKGRKQLNTDSDQIVNKVDDLQDLIEDLRKDVVLRGVRPLPRQLETVTKDITSLTKELKKMEDYMKREKPIWTKIWEKELEDVCQGRDELRLMEDLMVDLRDDLEKASETFALVEQATKEQMKDAGTGGAAATGRQFVKGLNRIGMLGGLDGGGGVTDPSVAKEGVLGEVRALQPNHENRLEAIERAERIRQKELETRNNNPLTVELSSFVEEGKLKKSGGFEEVERARKAKDERIRREVWERMNGIVSSEPEVGGQGDGVGEEGEEGEVGEENGEGGTGTGATAVSGG